MQRPNVEMVSPFPRLQEAQENKKDSQYQVWLWNTPRPHDSYLQDPKPWKPWLHIACVLCSMLGGAAICCSIEKLPKFSICPAAATFSAGLVSVCDANSFWLLVRNAFDPACKFFHIALTRCLVLPSSQLHTAPSRAQQQVCKPWGRALVKQVLFDSWFAVVEASAHWTCSRLFFHGCALLEV